MKRVEKQAALTKLANLVTNYVLLKEAGLLPKSAPAVKRAGAVGDVVGSAAKGGLAGAGLGSLAGLGLGGIGALAAPPGTEKKWLIPLIAALYGGGIGGSTGLGLGATYGVTRGGVRSAIRDADKERDERENEDGNSRRA